MTDARRGIPLGGAAGTTRSAGYRRGLDLERCVLLPVSNRCVHRRRRVLAAPDSSGAAAAHPGDCRVVRGGMRGERSPRSLALRGLDPGPLQLFCRQPRPGQGGNVRNGALVDDPGLRRGRAHPALLADRHRCRRSRLLVRATGAPAVDHGSIRPAACRRRAQGTAVSDADALFHRPSPGCIDRSAPYRSACRARLNGPNLSRAREHTQRVRNQRRALVGRHFRARKRLVSTRSLAVGAGPARRCHALCARRVARSRRGFRHRHLLRAPEPRRVARTDRRPALGGCVSRFRVCVLLGLRPACAGCRSGRVHADPADLPSVARAARVVCDAARRPYWNRLPAGSETGRRSRADPPARPAAGPSLAAERDIGVDTCGPPGWD